MGFLILGTNEKTKKLRLVVIHSTPDDEPLEDEKEDEPSSAYKASNIIAFIVSVSACHHGFSIDPCTYSY